MKTKEIIEILRSPYIPAGTIGEVIEKLRQLEDIKKMLSELWDASIAIDDLLYDMTKMFNKEEYEG